MESSPESPIRDLYRHLASKKPFHRALFKSDISSDQFYFHRTVDVQRIISIFEGFRQSDEILNGKRLLGVYSNIGDGKTTLLGFLSHLKKESILPIFINKLGSDDPDSSVHLSTLILFLLYELKGRGLLLEKDYNEAKMSFRKADSIALRGQVIEDQMRSIYPTLRGLYLVWLCDNVGHRSCLQAFQQLLDLRDPEPPASHFFGETPILIVFSTSDMDMLKAWSEDPNRAAAGHKLEWLRVRAKDMFYIVKQVLEASSQDLPNGLRQQVAELRKSNPVFPINAKDLLLFLRSKAKKERLEQARNEVSLEVSEIQLRNTLYLLQRLVDANATKNCDCLINLEVLMEEDLGKEDLGV